MSLRAPVAAISAATILMALAFAPSGHAQQPGAMDHGMKKGMGHGKMMPAKQEAMMRRWPKAAQDAAHAMMTKYGAPAEMNGKMAMWGATGPWKRTVVYGYEVAHDFPAHHTDVMQQWINYRVPPEKLSELGMFDGSVSVERTNGEISARCDKEGANLLALNLADEIITGKRSVADARKMYGEQIMAMKAGQPAPYTERLMFAPKDGTADPDHPLSMGMK